MVKLSPELMSLYKAKKYGELFDKLMTTRDDWAEVWEELCRKHKDISDWYMLEINKMWKEIFANPEMEQAASTLFEQGGVSGMYELMKRGYATGFVTADEIAEIAGISIAEQERIIAEYPEEFAGHTGFIKIQ
jgi:hypothetical protein